MASSGILRNGAWVMLKLSAKTMSEQRMYELAENTHVSVVYPVFGKIIECNHPNYKVEWMMRDSPKLVTMDMNINEIEPSEGFKKYPATYGPLGPNQTPNRLTPGEIQAAAAALTPGNDGGKKARRSRKSRKSRKVRKSYKKYRKSIKVRKSRRRARR